MKPLSILCAVVFSMSLSALADVLDLTDPGVGNPPRTVTTQNDFEDLLTDNNATVNRVFDVNGNLVPAQSNHLNFNPAAAQMPGIAAFVDHNGGNPQPSPVVISKKRQPAGNLPVPNIPDFLFTDILQKRYQAVAPQDMEFHHTERQLVSHILGNPAFNAQTEGNFFVFTKAPPCTNCVNDNGNRGCVDFYNDLAQHFPNIHFHVYFHKSEWSIPSTVIRDNHHLYQNLRTALIEHHQVHPIPHVGINPVQGPVIGGLHYNRRGLAINANNDISCFTNNNGTAQINVGLNPANNNLKDQFGTAVNTLLTPYSNANPCPNDIRQLKVRIMQKLYGFSDRISYDSLQ